MQSQEAVENASNRESSLSEHARRKDGEDVIENRKEREEERTREKGRKIEKNVVPGIVLEEKPFKSLAHS